MGRRRVAQSLACLARSVLFDRFMSVRTDGTRRRLVSSVAERRQHVEDVIAASIVVALAQRY